jgi:uncharacterized membrane protein YfcA
LGWEAVVALEVWQWAVIIAAALLVGISKTGITGMGIFAVALFSIVLPPRESVGTVLVTLIAGDLVAAPSYWREASWSHLVRLLPMAVVGVAIGALLSGRFNDAGLRHAIGIIIVVLTVFTLVRQRTNLGGDGEMLARWPWLVGLVGLTAGITTMIANAAGPIMQLYLLGQRLPKRIFVGTAAWYFFILNLIKVPFSIGLGQINPTSLALTVYLIPCAMVGGFIGRPILNWIDQKLFERAALVLTLIAGIRLLF